MYDLLTDPTETQNLAYPPLASLTPEQQAQRARLSAKLERVVANTLVPRLGVEWPVDIKASGTMDVVQVTALSRSEAGGVTGSPVGGYPQTGAIGASIEVVYTPLSGGTKGSCWAANRTAAGSSGAPCLVGLEWTVRAGAGSMQVRERESYFFGERGRWGERI